ncbi:ankyrin repeat domain-containing protein [Shewanella sp. A14]
MKYFVFLTLAVITSFLCGYFMSSISPNISKNESPRSEEITPHKNMKVEPKIEVPDSKQNSLDTSIFSFPQFIYSDLEDKGFVPEKINLTQWHEFKKIVSFELIYNLKLENGLLFSEYAIAKNEFSLIGSFIDAGINLNQKNEKGILPIVQAAQYSSFDFFIYLIQIGVEIPLGFDENPNNNIMKAASHNKSIEDRNKILDYLTNINIGFNSDYDQFISTMSLNSHLEKNKNFLSQISTIEENGKKLNILELMIKNGASDELIASISENVIKELCSAERLFSALHALALNKDVSEENILRILRNCENINQKGFSGVTPLMYAVKFRHLAYIDLLLKNGADISIADKNGNMALDYINQSKLPLTESEYNFLTVKLKGN